jgi:LppX/LprAFG-like lipoprotein
VKWVALAAAALAGTLSLTACGATSAVSTPVAQAATKTADKGSEHVTYSGTVSVAGQTMHMTGKGDFQNTPVLGAVSMTMKGDGQDTSVDAVMQGSTIYMRSPLFAKALPSGKSWLSLDLQKAGKQFGVDVSQFAQQSPTDVLTALEKTGTVTKVGDETLGGEQTTHYHALIDVSRISARLSSAMRVKTIPVDVWIGGDGLVRRITESVTAAAAGQTAATSMTTDFSNYGEQVNVQVPSADETLDMTKLGG